MKPDMLFANAALMLLAASALAASAYAAPAQLSPADEAAAFKAAGFKHKGKLWKNCDDPTSSYTAGAVEQVRDINGDGRHDAVLTEGGTFCYGHTGVGYSLVSKQADGSWKLITSGTGIVTFLNTKGAGGWLDIEIGGPGFCFPVLRWNGRTYALQRHQYEGKRCTPQ
jgi:hypothetical protein